MTSRERLAIVALGGATDRRPVIALDASPGADAVAVPLDRVGAALRESPETAVLAVVLSPLARAIRDNVPLVRALTEQPEHGHRTLDKLANETKTDLKAASESGADGVLYVLDGASPAHTTPMEYGGFFLEIDRSLLTEFSGLRFNVLYVAGLQDPYLDFVSDLPAHALAWEPGANVELAAVRSLRSGPLASKDDAADIALVGEVPAHKEAATRQ